MTNQEAIDFGEMWLELQEDSKGSNTYEFFKIATQVLKQDAIAQERYEDLCEYFGDAKDVLNSRDDFKAWLDRVKWHIRKAEELYEKYEQEPKYCDRNICVSNEYNGISCNECEVTKSQEPRVGHWKNNKCDVCGASRPPLFDNFCPNCGAKMVEPQESEEQE